MERTIAREAKNLTFGLRHPDELVPSAQRAGLRRLIEAAQGLSLVEQRAFRDAAGAVRFEEMEWRRCAKSLVSQFREVEEEWVRLSAAPPPPLTPPRPRL